MAAFSDVTLPTGASVAQGTVDVGAPVAGSLIIQQHSDRAVVNWDSFSIGQGGHVGFQQPGTGSAILNRVTGAEDSRIHGSLTANGQVFVVNPNGIFIGRNGTVSAGGGFVASTLDTRDSDFMAGKLRFEGNGAAAPVENAGTVRIGRGGYAALMGGRVSNSGRVTVPLGRIGFAAGELVTLDLSGDQFLQVAIPSASDDAEMRALIENSGRVSAEGGLIEMRAATARDAARRAINLSGVAEARSVSVRNGAIILGGGAGGTVQVTGRVTTQARAPRPQPQRARIQVETSLRPQLRPNGGDITITGAQILLDGADIDASGASGGQIRIGGDYQGAGSLQTAQRLSVDLSSRISANATGEGDGGRIILWSDLYTEFDGEIAARGGETGGDGGFVEVSGRQMLDFTGRVDTRAPEGAAGTLLLDPVDVTIQEPLPTTPRFENGNDFEPDGSLSCCFPTAVINVNDLEANLAMGNVTVRTGAPGDGLGGNGDITVAAQIDWLTANMLTFESNRDIAVNAPVNGASGSFVLTAPGSVSLNSGGDVTVASFSATATNLFVNGAAVTETGGGGTVDVQNFSMDAVFGSRDGSWQQNAPVLSAFSAANFTLSDQSTFLRAAGGDGTLANPYQLTDIYGVQGIDSQSLLDQNFVLANPIDATGTALWNANSEGPTGFDPIIGLATPFSGTLDGQGNTIDGLFIDRGQRSSSSLANAGLFDSTNGATVSNLNLSNVNIQGGFETGALVGSASNSTFDTISVTGTVGDGFNEVNSIGGLVGDLFQSDLIDSSFTGTVTSENPSTISQYVGGLVGSTFDGAITGSSFAGTVTSNGGPGSSSTRAVGGVVGSNLGLVADSTSTGTILVTGTGDTRVGGLAGRALTTDPISDSASFMDIFVTMTGSERIFVGGLVGHNQSAVLDSFAAGNIDVTTGGAPVVGGLLGYTLNYALTEPIFNVQALGDVDVTSTAFTAPGEPGRVGGLVGENIGPISQGRADGNVFVSTAGAQIDTGGFAGANLLASDSSGRAGTISESVSTAAVIVDAADGDDLSIGGFVGDNRNSITDSYADGPVAFTETVAGFPSSTSDAYVGGFAGTNQGDIARTAAYGPVDASSGGITLSVGGHTGLNLNGTISDSYVLDTSVSGTTDGLQAVGGFAGATSGGTISQVFSNALVSASGTGTALTGGLIGVNGDASLVPPLPETALTGGFWDLDTSGQADGGAAAYGTGLSTAEFQDTEGFRATAMAGGWSFSTVWAPGAPGNYPALYSIDPVVFALPDPITLTYGTTGSASVTGTVFGGPGSYVFGPTGDTLDTSTAFDAPVFSDFTVGTQSVTVSLGTLTSALGQPYRAVTGSADAEITPAPLTITPDDQSKTYGDLFTFAGTEFTSSGLLFADSVGSVTLASDGAAATAGVGLSPYDITATAALGSGLGNYAITYGTGSLAVTPLPREVQVDDQSKVYGTAFAFAGTEFADPGLLFSDVLTRLDLSSAGAVDSATVVDGPYAISGTVAAGSGLENYDLVVLDGTMAVTPAPLTITPDDQSKLFGDLFTFGGTEFSADGLVLTDAVTGVTLTSDGAAATAAVAGSPYLIFADNAQGSGLANYDIRYGTGALSVGRSQQVNEAPLTRSIEALPPNATDDIQLVLALTGEAAVDDARDTLALVQSLAGTLEIAADACAENLADADRYLACLSDALDDFANELDAISTDLPPGMENVARIVRDAKIRTDRARARASSRLAAASNEAQRSEIRREALNEARAAMGAASAEIRKAINFARADDPELAAIRSATVSTVAAAVDSVGIKLARAVGL
ncbi:beta strand repeat-containing protein [Puniceibacterium confluentis]|uniref:beta strand repeat-containing protein n=1 Tax=Puniceibacterium confluentis TaxID=1958944 RepID=UPI001647213C|nr:MBG domain-containing protein [Puniceibacterium confluentis]